MSSIRMADEDLLLQKSLDGLLSAQEELALDDRLTADSRLARRLLELARQDTLLRESACERVPVRTRRLPSLLLWMAPLGVAAAVLLAVYGLLPSSPPEVSRPMAVGEAGWDRIVRDYLDASFEGDPKGAEAALGRLVDAGDEGVLAVESALADALREQEVSLEEVRAWLKSRAFQDPSGSLVLGRMRPVGRDLDWPTLAGEPLAEISCLSHLKHDLKLLVSLRRGEPDVGHPLRTLLSFEWLADRGEWDIAARCVEDGKPETARRLYGKIETLREASDRPLNWRQGALSDGRVVFALIPSEKVVAQLRWFQRGNTLHVIPAKALAQFGTDIDIPRYLLRNIVEGDQLELD